MDDTLRRCRDDPVPHTSRLAAEQELALAAELGDFFITKQFCARLLAGVEDTLQKVVTRALASLVLEFAAAEGREQRSLDQFVFDQLVLRGDGGGDELVEALQAAGIGASINAKVADRVTMVGSW